MKTIIFSLTILLALIIGPVSAQKVANNEATKYSVIHPTKLIAVTGFLHAVPVNNAIISKPTLKNYSIQSIIIPIANIPRFSLIKTGIVMEEGKRLPAIYVIK